MKRGALIARAGRRGADLRRARRCALVGAHRLPPLPTLEAIRLFDRRCSTATGGCCGPMRPTEGRWRLPATRRRCRSALSRHADRLRGPALPRASRRRSAGAGARRLAVGSATAEIVSGGSTLTMQVARLLEPRTERTLRRQAAPDGARDRARARARARTRSSRSISSLAPYGGNLEGVRAASLAYFGKEPRRLSLRGSGAAGRAAAIAGSAPAGPLAAAARSARATACSTASPADAGIPADEVASAKAEPVPPARRPMPVLAPHAADQAVAAAPQTQACIDLTIDARLQRALEDAGARARACARRRIFRSRSSRSIMRPARSWRASPRPIISTSAAPGRST